MIQVKVKIVINISRSMPFKITKAHGQVCHLKNKCTWEWLGGTDKKIM